MVRVQVNDDTVDVTLNPLEAAMALRRRVSIPLADVLSSSVVSRPWNRIIPTRVSMGFAGAGAPGARLVTVGPRARSGAGKALVVVYLNRPSLVIDIDPARTGWSLIIISSKEPERIRDALIART